MADNVSTVAAIYEAFGRGDVDTILGHLAHEIEWEAGVRDTGLPYLRERRGKAEVATFFGDLAANLVLTHFEPVALCDGGDVVAVPIRHAGTIVDGGEVPMTTEVHVWRFGTDGAVTGFNHVFDLAVHERAAAARSAALQGRTLRAVGDTILVERAGGRFEMFEVSGPAESGPPPHAHPWDEAYIGIEGRVEVTVGETTTIVGPGDVAVAPAGELHSYRILTDSARFRVITSGHRASMFFADLDRNVDPGPITPETLPGIVDVALRNGLTSPLFA